MPWVCQVCRAEYPGVMGVPGTGPKCYATEKCKGKGSWACTWVQPVAVAAPVVLTEGQRAATLGYPARYNSHGDTFPAGHKTSVMYVNAGQTRGISFDGSTHSGGREGWKGFNKTAKGWSYAGSYQLDLQPWAHRPNEPQVAFPRGN